MNGLVGGVLWTGFPFLLADRSAPGMPNKHNDDRRRPIPTMTFTVTKWAIYEGGTTGRSTFAPSPKLAIECTYIAPTVRKKARADRLGFPSSLWLTKD